MTYGMISLNNEFIQQAKHDENLLMLPYLGVCMMIGSQNMILYAPLVLHGLLTSLKPLQTLRIANPSLSSLLNSARAQRAYLIALKADLEVYLGFYVFLMWFFRRSHLISIVFYW